MKLLLFVTVNLALLLCTGHIYGNEIVRFGSYSLPIVEAEVLLTRWLRHQNLSVTSNVMATGETVINGTSNGKLIKLSLLPHSPLATNIVLLECSGIGGGGASDLKSAWESYLAGGKSSGNFVIPERVRSFADTVVCINAPSQNENKLNFTGFLIDQKGTVLTIAHDVDPLRNYILLFTNGAIEQGRVIKKDSEKDLSIIESNLRGSREISPLNNGRSKLNFGDRIFMLCCSNGSIQIQEGVLDKPKAEVGTQTLLQVKLENVFPGSSGSPAVDENGMLVGVVKGRYRGTDSRGFLIPFDTIRSFMEMGKK